MKFTGLFPRKRRSRVNVRPKKTKQLRDHKGIASGWLNSYSRMLFFVCVAICMTFVYFGTISNVNIYVDGALKKQITTNSRTVGELFAELDIETHAKDKINRTPGEHLRRHDNIHIEKAFPVFVTVDSSVSKLWTASLTVGEFLEIEGIELGDFDEVIPDLNEKVDAYADIKIVRIEKIYTDQEKSIPYELVYRDNPALDRGMTRVVTEGEEGVKKETFEIVIADGEEVSREIVDEHIVEPPRDEIIENGTMAIVPGTDVDFEQSFSVSATAYCAGTPGSGCPINSSGHAHCTGIATGRTATGARAIAGSGSKSNPHIIAVDPGFIPLHSTVYIDGYGYAVALDTGGAVRGNTIDLLFATHQEALRFGRRNLKVYLLE